ncbi:MAG: hypothetical protein WB471_10325 [Nocardioides sp.]
MLFLSRQASRRRPSVLVLAAVLALTLAAPTAAMADRGSDGGAGGGSAARPVANDDSFSIYASGEYILDVLSNDSTTLLGTGDLTLCGLTVPKTVQQVLYAEIDRDDPSQIFVEANRNAKGVVRFTYDACQGDQRDTSTVRVDISLLASPKVTKARKRGRISANNPNDARLQILWGSNAMNVQDGERSIGPGRRVTIAVERRRVYWVAYLVDQGAVIVAGDGTVTKIKPRR